jgi:membrane-associated phospholipid phosphatase
MISSWATVALVTALAQTPARSTPPRQPPVVQTVAPAATPENPFTHLLPHLGRDLQALGTIQNGGILVTGGIFALVFKNNDDARLHAWVLKQDPSPSLASMGNVIGDGWTQGGAAVAVWLAGREVGNARVETTGANLIRAQLLNGLLTQSVKYVVQRDRPDGGSRSFPSGHTSATFATAAVIQHDYGVVAALPVYALGGLVGWSRVRTNHHWLSDATFGAALGIVSGRAASHDSPARWTVTPVKTSGGAAIYVTRTWPTRTTSSPRR